MRIPFFLFVFILSSGALPSFAQDSPPAPPAEQSAQAASNEAAKTLKEEEDKQSVAALSSVRESIVSLEKEISELTRQEKSAPELEQEALRAQIKSLQAKKSALQADFESIATGIDPKEYDEAVDETFVLSDEIDAVLRPIVEELKDLTEKPREIEDLKRELTNWERRLETTEDALLNLSTIPEEVNTELKNEIVATRQKWSERRKQAENRVQAITYQLEQAEKNRPSIFETFRNSFQAFFRSRGRNLLLCTAVFIVSFVLLRFIHERLHHLAPWKRKGERPFYIRLVDVGLNFFSVVGAILASFLVLYATGDWVLMGIAIILLVGVILAAKNGLPKVFEHGRILLNLGEVREGERVVFNGIPWRVNRLSFYTILVNEQLRGGLLRLPLRQVGELISRPIADEGEQWFPCNEGDWLKLPDEGIGRVISQTPEHVQIVKLGGAKVTIPTADFLSKSAVNLSGSFRISSTFGVDYKLQEISTTIIPEKMWAFMTRELCSVTGDHELLLSLKVEFASAGASSLDFEIIADFDGSLAPKYQALTRAIQRIAVDCCNENGWEIPFTQITLHNAYPAKKKKEVEPEKQKPKLP